MDGAENTRLLDRKMVKWPGERTTLAGYKPAVVRSLFEKQQQIRGQTVLWCTTTMYTCVYALLRFQLRCRRLAWQSVLRTILTCGYCKIRNTKVR